MSGLTSYHDIPMAPICILKGVSYCNILFIMAKSLREPYGAQIHIQYPITGYALKSL